MGKIYKMIFNNPTALMWLDYFFIQKTSQPENSD